MKTIKFSILTPLLVALLFSFHCKKNNGGSGTESSAEQKKSQSTPDLGVKKEDIYGKWMYNLKESGNSSEDYVYMYFCPNGYATFDHGYGGYNVYSWKLGEDGISFQKHKTCLAETNVPPGQSYCAKNHKTWKDELPPTIKLENVKKGIAGKENIHRIKIERVKNFPKQCDPNFEPKSSDNPDDFSFE